MESTSPKNSAVVVPIIEFEPVLKPLKLANSSLEIAQESKIILTLRTQTVEHHKGQISFPGGRQDDEDLTLQHTALRELDEEIGIKPQQVRIVHQLKPVYTMASNFQIYPFIGLIRSPLKYQLNQHETKQIIEVPLAHLLDRSNSKQEIFERNAIKFKIKVFYFEEFRIWGATAMILDQFLKLLK